MDKKYREISGILVFLAGIIFLLGLISYNPSDYKALVLNRPVHNLIGPVGAFIGHIFRSAFGLSAYLLIVMMFMCGWSLLKFGDIRRITHKLFSIFFITVSTASFFALIMTDIHQNCGGFIGYYIYHFFRSITGLIGAYLIIMIMNLVGFILLGTISLVKIVESGNVSKISGHIKRSLNRVSPLRYRDMISLKVEEKPLGAKDKKPPWIVKKRVTIGGENKASTDDHTIKLIGMDRALQDYSSAGEEAASKSNMETGSVPAGNFSINYEGQIHDLDEFNLDPAPDTFTVGMPEEMNAETDQIRFDRVDREFLADKDNAITVIDNTVIDDTNDPVEFSLKKNRIFQIERDDSEPEIEIAESEDTHNIKKNPAQGSTWEDIVSEERVFRQLRLNREYVIPTSFLNNSEPVDSETWGIEIRKNSSLLVRTLSEFGIESRVINVNRGPVITLYEMQIAAGIKINRVVGLADDIAMALAAYRVRIVAPIPGKSAIGVEIPNTMREMVTLGDVIRPGIYKDNKWGLIVGLGKDILGNPVTLDLKKLPHLLIAGSTGSGKSVCVNSIIMSIVYNYDPNYARFILVDPKMVELQLYNGTPHLLTPVITEPHLAPGVLKWSIYEMERRYRLLAAKNTRDISSYNDKVIQGGSRDERLPYIIIIIDELADLMMVATKDMEGYITRIAQKARAVGIHLVLATQRPSVDVITGIIKANFPARIAFQVAQKTDSRTIIDQNGAEKLLGKGDMLYQSPHTSYPVRIQGAFISEDEIMKVVSYLRTIGEPDYIDIEAPLFSDDDGDMNDENDDLFVEALKIVEDTRKASASYLQRRLSIGYNRAAKMIEKMEDLGYIGPQQGSKPRDIFI